MLSTLLVAQTSSFTEIKELISNQQELVSKISKIYQCMTEEKQTVAFSTINAENFNKFLEKIDFSLNPVVYTGHLPRNDIEPYVWKDYAESESDSKQREQISQYLNQTSKTKPSSQGCHLRRY